MKHTITVFVTVNELMDALARARRANAKRVTISKAAAERAFLLLAPFLDASNEGARHTLDDMKKNLAPTREDA